MRNENTLSCEEKTALLITHRVCRHSGLDQTEQLLSLIDKVGLRNREKLENSGLTIIFSEMKNDIVNNPYIIGLILFGLTNIDIYLSEYITHEGNRIVLTIHSVCNILLEEYFEKNEINTLCKTIPLYSSYANKI